MKLRLASLIKKAGMTQTALADSVDVSRSYMSLLVSGQRDPSPALLQRMADALNVTVSELFEGQPEGVADNPAVEPIKSLPKNLQDIADAFNHGDSAPMFYTANRNALAFGILTGDILVVERNSKRRAGDIALVNNVDETGHGTMMLCKIFGDWMLPADPSKNPVELGKSRDIEVLGIVAASFRGRKPERQAT